MKEKRERQASEGSGASTRYLRTNVSESVWNRLRAHWLDLATTNQLKRRVPCHHCNVYTVQRFLLNYWHVDLNFVHSSWVNMSTNKRKEVTFNAVCLATRVDYGH